MIKIAFMGAGSTVFARNVLGDCMCTPALREAEIALYDIDAKRLEDSQIILEAINRNINDGKAVIQPAALTLSGLDREETLEMHTLENAIVLLKPDIEPVEKAAAMMTVMRLAHSLWEDMLADWENQEDDEDMCDGCHGCDEDMLPIPAEAFEDADILYDNLRVISVDGAVLVVSDDRKTAWSESLTKAILESEKAND